VADAAPPPPPLQPALTCLTQPHFTSVDAFEGDPPPLSLASTCSTQCTATSFTGVYAFDEDPSLSLHRRVWSSLTASSFTSVDMFDGDPPPPLHRPRRVRSNSSLASTRLIQPPHLQRALTCLTFLQPLLLHLYMNTQVFPKSLHKSTPGIPQHPKKKDFAIMPGLVRISNRVLWVSG